MDAAVTTMPAENKKVSLTSKKRAARRPIAYHEAGHAVAARALAITVFSVHMDPDADSAARLLVEAYVDPADLVNELRAHLIVVLTGLAAETIAGYQNDNRNVDDLSRAGALAGRLAGLSPSKETLVEQVGIIVARAAVDAFALLVANWTAVVRVAGELQKHDYLTDDDLDDILARVQRGRRG